MWPQTGFLRTINGRKVIWLKKLISLVLAVLMLFTVSGSLAEATAENAAAALKELGGIECEQAIRYYGMLLDGKSIADLRVAAERDRRSAMEDMV